MLIKGTDPWTGSVPNQKNTDSRKWPLKQKANNSALTKYALKQIKALILAMWKYYKRLVLQLVHIKLENKPNQQKRHPEFIPDLEFILQYFFTILKTVCFVFLYCM